MPVEFKELLVSQDPVNSSAKHTHAVQKGTLRNDPTKKWIVKKVLDPNQAKREVLAQEFFRLFIPHQPETRLMWDADSGVYYVLSEEIPGYKNLPSGHAAGFGDGTYTGLGQAMVVALLLQEIDFKNGNVGLDDHNRVIKIDGDWCFAPLNGWKNSLSITPDVLEQLPSIHSPDFIPHNWLDYYYEGIAQAHPGQIVAPSLRDNPQFRTEVNEALFNICLLPDSFIEEFVAAYIDTDPQLFVRLIKERRDQLYASALQNQSFIEYKKLASQSGASSFFIKHLWTFQANNTPLRDAGKNGLMTRGANAENSLWEPYIECEDILEHMKLLNNETLNTRVTECVAWVTLSEPDTVILLNEQLKAELVQALYPECAKLLDYAASKHMDVAKERALLAVYNYQELSMLRLNLLGILQQDCKHLLNEINQKGRVNIAGVVDEAMDKFLADYNNVLEECDVLTTAKTLSAINDALTTSEIVMVLAHSQALREKTGYSIEGEMAAQYLDDALVNTPSFCAVR